MKKFPDRKKLNLAEVAETLLEKWSIENTFEKSISSRPEKKSFCFFRGPPPI
jgi:isoleucyl-tRNA synthetase